jgi:hypothetical protein
MCQMTSSTASGLDGYPHNVQDIFPGQPEGSLDAVDHICKDAPQLALASVVPLRQHCTSAA